MTLGCPSGLPYCGLPGRSRGSQGLPQEGHEEDGAFPQEGHGEAGDSPKKATKKPEVGGGGRWYCCYGALQYFASWLTRQETGHAPVFFPPQADTGARQAAGLREDGLPVAWGSPEREPGESRGQG